MSVLSITTVLFHALFLCSANIHPNEDILTVLKRIIQHELKPVIEHIKYQDAKEKATEEAVAKLVHQNIQLKTTLNDLKMDIKAVNGKVDELKKMENDVKIVKNVLTSPLPGKTRKKPIESCQWLNERFYNLHNGYYWTTVNGSSKYSRCNMSEAGIPPVRCTTKPCHPNATCEDTDTGVKCTCACGYVGDGKDCQKSFAPVKKGNGTLLIQEACPSTGNNLVTTFKHVRSEYKVQFEMKPLKFAEDGYYNIIHFSAGGDMAKIGDRIPAVWLQVKGSGQLRLCTGLNNNVRFCKCGADTAIPLNEWSLVEIKQVYAPYAGYVYTIVINGRQVVNTVNEIPREYQNVKLYLSDPWYASQEGYIRNLYVEGYE